MFYFSLSDWILTECLKQWWWFVVRDGTISTYSRVEEMMVTHGSLSELMSHSEHIESSKCHNIDTLWTPMTRQLGPALASLLVARACWSSEALQASPHFIHWSSIALIFFSEKYNAGPPNLRRREPHTTASRSLSALRGIYWTENAQIFGQSQNLVATTGGWHIEQIVRDSLGYINIPDIPVSWSWPVHFWSRSAQSDSVDKLEWRILHIAVIFSSYKNKNLIIFATKQLIRRRHPYFR